MKRRLILHMGLPKTGSTSIQSFLRDNPDALAAAGAHYPKTAEETQAVAGSSGGKPYLEREISHAVLAREIKRRGKAPAPAETPLWARALARLDASGAATGIISYEHFSTRPALYKWRALDHRLRAFEKTGLVYLREPESWAVSLYGQFLRRRTRPTYSFAEFLVKTEITGGLSRLLDNLRDHARLDDLVVRDFEAAAASGLVRDFLSNAGLRGDILEKADRHPSKNSSLPAAALLFIRACNRAGLDERVCGEVRQMLGEAHARGEMPELRVGLDLVQPSERMRLRAEASADAERLAHRWGLVFSRPRATPPPYRAFDHEDFAAMRETIGARLSPVARAALADVR